MRNLYYYMLERAHAAIIDLLSRGDNPRHKPEPVTGGNGDVPIRIKRLSEDAVIPTYAKPGDAGFDLYATEDVSILPEHTEAVPIGISMEIPEGYEVQIRPRSGLSVKTALRVANSPGTIDSGYRGEIKVLLHNTTPDLGASDKHPYSIDGSPVERQQSEFVDGTYMIRKGDRIAQGVLSEVPQARFEVVEELTESERGTGGFGSTGVGKTMEDIKTKIEKDKHKRIDRN